VIVVLTAMAISSFIISKEKYSQLTNNFYMIHASEERMQSITSINANSISCLLMNKGIIERDRLSSEEDYFYTTLQEIYKYGVKL